MSKRKLSKQQNERVKKRRQAGAGNNAKPTGTQDGGHLLGPEQEGLVISHFRNKADIENISDQRVIRCHLRANLGQIVSGDKVLWQESDTSAVVSAVFPRKSLLHRPDSYGKLKLVAANVSQAIVTLATEPQAHQNLIDRYLVATEHLDITPVILINKIDIVDDNDPLLALLEHYKKLGYTVLHASAHSGNGLEQLKACLVDETSIFVGQSGVGKSSLIQALLPDEELKIGELSEQVKKGRHTTTHARLYHFESGGDCIDSPGIRDFGLWHLKPEEVAQGFIEFREYLENCRFRDCRHQQEPGCGLQTAVEAGHIRPERFASYEHIVRSLDDVTMRHQ